MAMAAPDPRNKTKHLTGPITSWTQKKTAEFARGQARAALASSRHDEWNQKPILPHPSSVK
jgi:hypothetical protein